MMVSARTIQFWNVMPHSVNCLTSQSPTRIPEAMKKLFEEHIEHHADGDLAPWTN